ncbi:MULTISPECIES: peptidoglycan editing factor PgeF [unclassified Marinobacter]|uniref:peptidoglycan editing factor PgeF n=1 Tax=unclassified Marinobacter TaxID=83889 RepID=UPI001927709D|nr:MULTISPECIES: peptidoglycan editing factor PgeF [unclassified Marinobacter]MBL3826239.1 peptidoglycan editing factor PgeF [Marinobacter sp. MC3]MBL3894745.1 peptidoglycan editing factor PgeF [Marinobacter sp. MW3]
MTIEDNALKPDWSAPHRVRAISTTRVGGVSVRHWNSLNLGSHVEDNPKHVQENRRRLAESTGLDSARIGWLNQVHGTEVVELNANNVGQTVKADASFTRDPGIACAILTADCLPVILADTEGTVVGAAHCGWRSLCGGVIENLVSEMAVAPETLQAWLGPAIGPERFEVGPEVRDAFIKHDPEAAHAFKAEDARPGHFMADIYALATLRLNHLGVYRVTGGGLCTVQDPDRFFSYRRDGQTGRMATLVWLTS